MDETSRNLTTRQDRALYALLTGRTVTEAAKLAGVARQTVSGWVNHHPAFQDALEAHRASYGQSVRDQLEEAALDAVATLVEVMQDPEAAAKDRIHAAEIILDRCGLGDPTRPHTPTEGAPSAFDLRLMEIVSRG